MNIPLINRIPKESYRQIAIAQDIIVEEVCKVIPTVVFHGGTCIWRCYSGKRFSEDVDFYFPTNKKIAEIFNNLKKQGFTILKQKISMNSVYSELLYNRNSVRLEGTFQTKKGVLIDYKKVDETIISIYGLTPEQLIHEKILTYGKRKKVRDLYDIFFLLKYTDFTAVKTEIKQLIDTYEPPFDETDLRTVIIEGLVPTAQDMIAYIKRKWENPNI